MARKGEVADIVSKSQYDYFLKQAQSAMPKTDRHHRPITKDGKPVMRNTPLDSRGQARNALRDRDNHIVQPGAGRADPPPSAQQAMQALAKFHNAGGSREGLPEKSNTKDAYSARQEHAQMKNDQVVGQPTRPRGSSTYERHSLKSRGHKARKGRYIRNNEGGWEYVSPSQLTLSTSKEYLSKSINEEFNSKLDEALRL